MNRCKKQKNIELSITTPIEGKGRSNFSAVKKPDPENIDLQKPSQKSIVIVRHGSYTDEGNLSKEGVEEVKSYAKGLKDEIDGRQSGIIYTSPLPRAVETAEILAHELNFEKIEKEELREDVVPSKINKIRELISEVKNSTYITVILVTHQPVVGALTMLLKGKRTLLGTGEYLKIDV